MPVNKIYQHNFEKTIQALSWFTLPQLLTLYEIEGRSYRLERLLKKLSGLGKLRVEQYGHQKAYIAPRLARRADFNEPGHIEHGIATTDITIAFLKSGAQIVPNKLWHGKGIYPDASFYFDNGWFLPVEFATKEHSRFLRIYKSKVTRYLKLLNENWQVLFVMDITEDRLEYLVNQYTPHEALYYISYEGFKQIPLGFHLTTPCYTNGATRKKEALK